MLRKILVPVRGDGKGDNVLAHAARLAQRHGAHTEVVHCRARPEDLMPYGVPVPAFMREQIVAQARAVADQEEAGFRRAMEVQAEKLGLTLSPPGIGPTAAYVEEEGRQIDVLRRRGRLADLIAVAKPDRDRNLGFNTLRAAIFNANRPVLMCPPREEPPVEMGASVTVAWNGSAEAARAVHQTLSILAGADRVTILSNGSDAGSGTTVADLLAYLDVHGIQAEVETLSAGGTVPQQLLAATRAVSADALIMGAYGDSHERETLFGGNTQQIVDHSDQPVIFCH
ncbi:MAG: universal stress protein [Pseudomonadota bacterium]